jgi:cell division protein ZapA
MPMVEVTVNGRRHAVQCGVGEEARVKRLASYIDRRVSELAKGQAQQGDTRLLLMASLMIADELSDAFDEIKRLQSALEERTVEGEQQAAVAVEQVARELEAIAARLESA